MVENALTIEHTGNYRSAFHRCIVATTEHLFNTVRQNSFILSEEIGVQMLHTLSYALRLQEHWSLVRNFLLSLAPLMRRGSFRDEWLPFLEAALALSKQSQDDAAAAALAYQIGSIYQWRANYTEAHRYLHIGANYFAGCKDQHGQAKALNRAAYVARLQRDYKQATQLVNAALHLLPADHPDSEFSYFVQGMIATDQGDVTSAINLLLRAVTLAGQTGDQHLLGMRTGALGTAYRRAGEYPAAADCYRCAIDLFGMVHDQTEQALMYMNLGNVFLLTNEPAVALTYYQLAEAPLQRVQDEYNLANLEHNQGLAYRDLNAWLAAEALLQRSIYRWQKLGNTYLLVNSLDDLGLLYLQQGRREQAAQTLQDALQQLLPIVNEIGADQLQASINNHLAMIDDGVSTTNHG